jgi:copper chaperone
VIAVPHRGITDRFEEREDMTEAEYKVTGMSCGHCEASVRGEVSKLAGVEDVHVSAASGTLKIVSSAELADEAVIAAVDEAGYTAVRA